MPSDYPTEYPSELPSDYPTEHPTTYQPTTSPSFEPTYVIQTNVRIKVIQSFPNLNITAFITNSNASTAFSQSIANITHIESRKVRIISANTSNEVFPSIMSSRRQLRDKSYIAFATNTFIVYSIDIVAQSYGYSSDITAYQGIKQYLQIGIDSGNLINLLHQTNLPVFQAITSTSLLQTEYTSIIVSSAIPTHNPSRLPTPFPQSSGAIGTFQKFSLGGQVMFVLLFLLFIPAMCIGAYFYYKNYMNRDDSNAQKSIPSTSSNMTVTRQNHEDVGFDR
jgi:hypothetical protein